MLTQVTTAVSLHTGDQRNTAALATSTGQQPWADTGMSHIPHLVTEIEESLGKHSNV